MESELLINGEWLNPPAESMITKDSVEITTEPVTDLWQRTYYGFRNNNAPALLWKSRENFSFTVQCSYSYKKQFDQCGVLIFLDQENWFKASIEFENAEFSRLGSVVTNRGYSDWATRDIPSSDSWSYRLSRRGPDFLIESSKDHKHFSQMRVFHLHELGPTTPEMGKSDPPLKAEQEVSFGIYACSPVDSSFTATFSGMCLEPCLWKSHS